MHFLVEFICIFAIAGNKDKLAERILRAESGDNGIAAKEEEINSFLEPRGHSNTKPKIIQDYGLSFNHVDRLNKVRSYVKYRPKVQSEDMKVFISLIEMAAIQAWTLTIGWREEAVNEENHVLESLKNLAFALYPRHDQDED